MPHTVTRLPLPTMSPGTARHHLVHRFGTPGARPKAYLHAALHADEIPGLLVLRHLMRRLAEADADGAVSGEVVVVPFANPIGLAQVMRGDLLGRYAFASGDNFNRGFPALGAAACDALEGRLGDTAEANATAIRAALAEALAAHTPPNELEAQRVTLLGLALDADIALDLHCDSEAVMHVFTSPRLWPDAADLAAQLGSRATMLAVESGGDPFDEALSRPWAEIADRFGDRHPVPMACLSATVELRGTADVGDRFAVADADNLFRFLARRGVIDADPGPLPAPLCDATPLEGVGYVVAPAAGVVSYLKEPGDTVEAGETVATLSDPAAEDPRAEPLALTAPTAGVLFGRTLMKFARPGDRICKIAGATPLPGHTAGALLTD